MKRIFSISLLIFSCFLIACEEDVESGLSTPVLDARGVQTDRFSFAITIEEDGVNGRLYYLVQTTDKAKPSAQEINGSPLATSFDLNGSDFKLASMPGLAPKTDYTLYAIVALGDQLSKVASLQVTTQ
ncbi:hypothetical protein [Catalinimonas niigatensis]|uniref:hypothetical protein n=1 Tax=Catalinimonas niigatensis TaxID=1397264 RepID=UPI0026662DEB|nr:hypothetical protein [Catalinimonas niigatensis]WPP48597.1 hypothetical protein PZB72_18160 [Catalinimonas niigatensis]